jgi:hypothetical protein
MSLLPRVPLLYELWPGDDEIPTSATILFDASVSRQLPVDALLAGCEIASRAILAAADA